MVSDANKGTASDICSATRRVVSAIGPPGRQSGGWRGLGSLRRIAERHEDVAPAGVGDKGSVGPCAAANNHSVRPDRADSAPRLQSPLGWMSRESLPGIAVVVMLCEETNPRQN